MAIDGCGISSPPIRAFKNFLTIIKIRTDGVCCICIHVSTCTMKSINQYPLADGRELAAPPQEPHLALGPSGLDTASSQTPPP